MTPAEFATIRRSVGLCADCGRDAGSASRCARHLKTHCQRERSRRLAVRVGAPKRPRRLPRREAVLTFIIAFHAEHGHAPTTRDIGENTGIQSLEGVAYHVHKLVAAGAVTRGALTSRGHRIRLVTKKEEKAA